MQAHFHAEGFKPIYGVAFVAFIAAFTLLAILSGGWHKLAKKYKFKGNFAGEKIKGFEGFGIDSDWYVLWCGINKTSLRLTVKANRDGLYLRLFGPLAIRPTLLIPWPDIQDEIYDPTILGVHLVALVEKTGANGKQILLSFPQVEKVKLQMPQFIAEKIKAHSEGQWVSNSF